MKGMKGPKVQLLNSTVICFEPKISSTSKTSLLIMFTMWGGECLVALGHMLPSGFPV